MSTPIKDKIKTIFSFILLLLFISLAIYFTYHRYSKEEILINGKSLCTQIMNASITYYHEHGKYLLNNKVSFNRFYPLDARTNPYFSVFSTYPVEIGKQGISVFGSGKMEGYELQVVFNNDDKPKAIKNMKIKVIKDNFF